MIPDKEDTNVIMVADLVRMIHWNNETNFLINNDSFLAPMKWKEDWSVNKRRINRNLALMITRIFTICSMQKNDPVDMKNTERMRPKGKEYQWMKTKVIKNDVSKNES